MNEMEQPVEDNPETPAVEGGGDDAALEEGVAIHGEAPVIPVIEAALMSAGKPLTLEHLAALFDEDARPDKPTLKQAMVDLGEQCEGRGFELKEVASGWRFQVRQELAPWVGRLWDEKPQRYTRALLETLALIAYRQPITRGEIEDIRGVSVSTNIIRTLQERDWVRVVGHRDVPGRPAMYATTRQFLDYFNLQNLDELPPLAELRDLDAIARKLEGGAGDDAQSELQLADEEQASDSEEQDVTAEETTQDKVTQDGADVQDASALVSVEKAQEFQEEGNENIDKLFADLDQMEDGLTLNYTDYNPLEQEVPVLQDEVVLDKADLDKEPEPNTEIDHDEESSADDISSIMDEITAERPDDDQK